MKRWMIHIAVGCIVQAGLTTSAMAQTGRCCVPRFGECHDAISLAECDDMCGNWLENGNCLDDPCDDEGRNDSCPLAQPIGVDEPVRADNSNATDNDDVPACGTSAPAGGLWYVVMGTGNTMTVTTCNRCTFEADFDTKVQVFCNCDEYTCIDGNDDVDCIDEGLQSTVTWCSLEGQPYYIHVGGASGERGLFELLVTDDGVPCDNAIDCGGPVMPECAVDTLKFEVKENELKWKIFNQGETTLTIASITLEWPEYFGDLKEVEFGDDLFKNLASPPTVTLTSDDFLGKLDDRQVAPGKDEELRFKFTEKVADLIDRDPAGFGIYVEFEEGCHIEWTRGEYPDCVVSTEKFEVGDDKFKWKIRNDGLLPLTIASITVDWPAPYGDLKQIDFEGKIFDDFASPPTATITDFIGDYKNRQVKVGDSEELEVKFTDKVSDALLRNPSDFYVYVEFVEGCAIEWIPGEDPQGVFACDKPVDEITLVWDGVEPIRVRAYKGDVGSEMLADYDHVQISEEITVSGLAGSPNNVYFEIFAAGTLDELGESTFHLSCSDDDMDGAEDCGKRAGDGKGNDSGMINDWILEGMVDSVGVLDCTP